MAQKDQATPTANIQRVPSFLRERECLKKYFEPMWISFGPIHYNNPKLKFSKMCKGQLVKKFIHDSGYSSHEELYEEIESNIIGLEQFYDEEVIQRFTNKETLNRILIYDGCAILQFIASSSSPHELKELKELKIKVEQAAFINCDLLLLENQIPYRLLMLLMDKSKNKVKLSNLYTFIRRNVMAPVKYQEEIFKAEPKTNPAHLLDLFRLALLQHPAAPAHDPDFSSTSGSSNVMQPAHDPDFSSTSGSSNVMQPAHDRRDCCELIIYSLKKYLLLPIIRQKRACSVFLARHYEPGGGGGEGGAPVRSNNNAGETTLQAPARNYEPGGGGSGGGAPVRSDNNAGETTVYVLAYFSEPGGGGGEGGAPVRSDNNAGETTLQAPDHQQDLIKQRDQSFRSIQDLKAAGINLKPSKSCSLKDIKFSSMGLGFVGELVLPPLMVDDSMAPKFMNLIAYEMCPDNMETNYEVTSYICFLDSLIDYAADVKELRTAGILRNILGSDKQVAKLFNEIATDLVPNNEVYKKVINDIERHYKNKWTTWMAQVCSDHFSTPWTILAFLAAVLVLFMTAVQTWFTVYPPPGPCDEFCRKL